MVTQGNTLAVINAIKHDYSGGRRLYEAAYDAVDECGHDVLDPIHIIYAALADEDAPVRVKQLIERYGFTADLVDAVLALVEVDLTRANIVAVDEGEYMALDAVGMYADLALRFEVHVEGFMAMIKGDFGEAEVTWTEVTDADQKLPIEQVELSHWDFYVAQFQVATESGAASIARLHALAYHARS